MPIHKGQKKKKEQQEPYKGLWGCMIFMRPHMQMHINYVVLLGLIFDLIPDEFNLNYFYIILLYSFPSPFLDLGI